MKLPEKIKIGGHIYKVIFPHRFIENTSLCGQISHTMQEIRLGGGSSNGAEYSEEYLMVVFVHEIIHAIDELSGHRIFVDNENAIDGFAEMVFQILVDNGWLKLSDETTDK